MGQERRTFLSAVAVSVTSPILAGVTSGRSNVGRDRPDTAALGPTVVSDQSPSLETGVEVIATAPVNVRTSAEVARNVRHTQPAGIQGTINDGSVEADGFVWWRVDWENGPAGWSVQQYLDSVAKRPDPRPIANTTDLRRRVDVTGSQIDAAIEQIRPDSPLIGLGDTWVRTQEKQGVDAIYQAAHAIWESGWGTSKIAQDKHNLYGFDARDACPYECANGFDSFEESIRQVMEYIDRRYLSPDGQYHNGPHLKGMNIMYATDPNWDSGITDVYNRLVETMPESDEADRPARDPETPPDRSEDDSDRQLPGDEPDDQPPAEDEPDDPGSIAPDDDPAEPPETPDKSPETPDESVPVVQPDVDRYVDKHLACRNRTCWTGFR